MGRVQCLIKQIEGDLRQIIVTILECQQDLTPPFFNLVIRKGWVQQGFKENIDAFIERSMLAVFLSWLAIGSISYAVMRNWQGDDESAADERIEAEIDDISEPADEAPAQANNLPKRGTAPFRLGMIEAGMLLGGVSTLFAAFVAVQFVYLFGGSANIGVEEEPGCRMCEL